MERKCVKSGLIAFHTWIDGYVTFNFANMLFLFTDLHLSISETVKGFLNSIFKSLTSFKNFHANELLTLPQFT